MKIASTTAPPPTATRSTETCWGAALCGGKSTTPASAYKPQNCPHPYQPEPLNSPEPLAAVSQNGPDRPTERPDRQTRQPTTTHRPIGATARRRRTSSSASLRQARGRRVDSSKLHNRTPEWTPELLLRTASQSATSDFGQIGLNTSTCVRVCVCASVCLGDCAFGCGRSAGLKTRKVSCVRIFQPPRYPSVFIRPQATISIRFARKNTHTTRSLYDIIICLPTEARSDRRSRIQHTHTHTQSHTHSNKTRPPTHSLIIHPSTYQPTHRLWQQQQHLAI